jgi:hypothetical protein
MAEIRVKSEVGRDIRRQAERLEREAEPWVEKLARLGYAAKGVVYITIGALATRVAAGSGGKTAGTEGAMESIARQPMGRVLAAFLALGLFGYALWRVVQAIRDPDHKGGGAKGSAIRAGYGTSGLIHMGLAIEGVRLAIGGGRGDHSESGVDSRTATLMEQPGGQWLVTIVGLSILAFGL